MVFSLPTTAKGINCYGSGKNKIFKEWQGGRAAGMGARNYLDLRIHGSFLGIVLVVVVGIQFDAVESKLLLYPVLESLPLFQGKTISLGNDRDNVHSLAELLQNDNVNWFQSMTGGLNEEQTAVDSSVLDVAVALGSKFLAQMGRMLVLDVLDDGIPAAIVVHKVTVARSIDNVQT